MDVNLALQELGKGPKGGNLEQVAGKAEWRRESFNGDELPNGERGLHRFVKDYDTASQGQKNEQPWHRMAAYMLNAGRTNSEIALAADVSPNTVSHIRAQRWFQELCATIANTEGEEVLGLIRSETAASIEKIVSIRDNEEAPLRVQLAAAVTLLEQGHGKPVQKTVSFVASTSFSSPADEMEQIHEELRALRAQSPEIPEADASVK